MMTKMQILDSKALVQRDTDGRWITLLELAVDTVADLPDADDFPEWEIAPDSVAVVTATGSIYGMGFDGAWVLWATGASA